MPHHSLEVFHKFFDHPNSESGEAKRWTDGWLFVIEASIVYPKSINSGKGGVKTDFLFIFYLSLHYFIIIPKTYARTEEKERKGDGKMKWKLTQRVTVFSFYFFILSPVLYLVVIFSSPFSSFSLPRVF